MAMSARLARDSTRQARQMNRNAAHVLLPHCDGEIQATSVNSSMTATPKLPGLKMCLPSKRRMNFEAMASTAPSTRNSGEEVRSSRQSEKEVMSELSGSNGTPAMKRPHSHCVASAVEMMRAMLAGVWSKPSTATP